MTLEEIKSAVESGKVVCFGNEGYVVRKDSVGQWLIICLANNYCIGLTWLDGFTLNGKPEEFFIKE